MIDGDTICLFKIPAKSTITKHYRDGSNMCFEYYSTEEPTPVIAIGTKTDEENFVFTMKDSK